VGALMRGGIWSHAPRACQRYLIGWIVSSPVERRVIE
jgi:hypothetical protein